MKKIVDTTQYSSKWKDNTKPFRIGRSFTVIPGGRRKRPIKGRTNIYLDSDLAFGTGLHVTTRFMVRLIERCRGRFSDFFDIGTGSGILSVAAHKCGAKGVLAIDISKDAVKIAAGNLKMNNCRNTTVRCADIGKFRWKRQFDLVCANLITQDLIQSAKKIIGYVKPGKYLAVSGVSMNSYAVFRKAYKKYALRCLKVEKDEGWTAMLFKKTG